MSNAIFFNSYKLKKGASVPDFLLAIEKLTKEHISKKKGYISSSLLRDGETWADYSVWKTMGDLETFLESSQKNKNDLAETFYSFLNINSCKSHVFSVEKIM